MNEHEVEQVNRLLETSHRELEDERMKAKKLIEALQGIVKSWDERCYEREVYKFNTEHNFYYWSPVESMVESKFISQAREVINQYNNKQGGG